MREKEAMKNRPKIAGNNTDLYYIIEQENIENDNREKDTAKTPIRVSMSMPASVIDIENKDIESNLSN